jgi:uncharacterized protein YraI
VKCLFASGLLILGLILAGCARPTPDSDLVAKAVQATLTASAPSADQGGAAPIAEATRGAATATPAAGLAAKPTVKAKSTDTPTSAPTATAEPTATPAPTDTPLPSDTPAPTATDTPAAPHVVASKVVNLRSGPGTNYPVVGATRQGQTYAVQGRTADGTWLEVCCIDRHTVWVAASVVATSGDFALVVVSQNIPPPPTVAPISASQIPAGWVEYADPAGRFVIWHPANWTASPGQGENYKEMTDLFVNAEEDQPYGHWMFFKVENTPLDKPSVTTRTDVVLDTRISTNGVFLPYDATHSISAVIMRWKYDIDPAVRQVLIQVLKTLKAK